MAKFRIEKPNSKAPSRSRIAGKVLLAAAVILLAGLAAFMFRPRPAFPSLEITQSSGKVEVYDPAAEAWSPVERGALFSPGGSLRTGEQSEADLGLEGLKLRLKAGSILTYDERGVIKPLPEFRLDRGELYAATEKSFDGELAIATAQAVIEMTNGAVHLANPDGAAAAVGVMRGRVNVTGKGLPGAGLSVGALEVLTGKEGEWEEPRKVSREEWNRLREIYELTVKSAAAEAEQLDLSKKAGTLFEYVFDHGTFYTPKMGYGAREFFTDENSGEIFLEQEYDVFPKGSFVGMYIKTRDLDLSKFSHLEFEMRKLPDQGYPQMVRIELKSKSGVVRAFAAKLPKESWEKYSFPLHVRQQTLMTELALVFLHDRVGEHKKGSIQLRNINVIPQEPAPVPPETVPTVPPAPAPTAVT